MLVSPPTNAGTTLERTSQIPSIAHGVMVHDTTGAPGERGAVQYPPRVRGAIIKRVRGGVPAIALVMLALFFSPVLADPPAPPVDINTTPPTLTPFAGDTAIEDRLDPASHVMIAGERLHEHLVRRFYAAHGWQTAWDRHSDVAAALGAEVLRADRQGLDPAAFHALSLGGRGRALSAIDRDLLLSDAILSYADALAQGAVPVGDRPDDEDLRPEPIDVVAVIDAAISAPDPAETIAALAPNAPEYAAMRRAYADYLTLAASGGTGAEIGAYDPVPRLSVAEALRRARQIAINLERMRWLPRDLPRDRLIVDAAVSQLQLFRDDVPVFTTRVVIGEVDKQTPELQSVVKFVLFNPPWNIPPSIVKKEILPKLAADHHYLAEHHMRWRGPMSVQQEAGPYSALGRLKFEINDRFDVYLHDTPERWRFQAAYRMMSHGCVRVENPRELASLLLGESPQAIDQAINSNRTYRRALPKPLPVFIVYRTAVVESDGSVAFRGDPYDRDAVIWAHLSRARELRLVQKSTPGSTDKVRAGQVSSTKAQKTAIIETSP